MYYYCYFAICCIIPENMLSLAPVCNHATSIWSLESHWHAFTAPEALSLPVSLNRHATNIPTINPVLSVLLGESGFPALNSNLC